MVIFYYTFDLIPQLTKEKLKKIPNISLILILTLLLSSCIERYWPDLGDKYDELLVVDGMITDHPGPYVVHLLLSSPLMYKNNSPVVGCAVTIADNFGNTEFLSETEPGQYQSTNPDFRGIAGRSYKLSIHTPEEKTYESDFQELKSPVAIDSVYAQLEYQPNPDQEADHELAGFQFYVNTAAATEDSSYYFWKLEQTYQFNSNYRIKYMFDGQFHAIPHPVPYYTCWKTNMVPEIITYNTLQLNDAFIKNLPLHFVTTETKELSIKYSVLVKQLTITKEAYTYWNSLEEQNAQGSLYEQQPYQVSGNITNVITPDEPVLGYFLVAGMDEKRVFVDKPEDLNFYYNTGCGMITEDLWRMLMSKRHDWPLFLTVLYDGEGSGETRALPTNQSCVDCREVGGNTEKPEFWED